jgi:polyisoprenoid-binding protein YceI
MHMHRFLRHTAAAAGLAALLAGGSAWAQQAVLPAQSQIEFTARQMGVPIKGHFRKFDGKVAFDPAKPQAGSVQIGIDMSSATMGVKENDAELPKADWFNVAKFPRAEFQSTAIKPLGGDKYEVSGKLTIKGASQNVQLPVTIAKAGAGMVATGTLPIKRTAFKVGDGDWADTSMVADEVSVAFKIAVSGVSK